MDGASDAQKMTPKKRGWPRSLFADVPNVGNGPKTITACRIAAPRRKTSRSAGAVDRGDRCATDPPSGLLAPVRVALLDRRADDHGNGQRNKDQAGPVLEQNHRVAAPDAQG